MKYYYVDHLYGNLYSSSSKLSYDDLYCEECGDSDDYLGEFETEEEARLAYEKYMGNYLTKEEILSNTTSYKETDARNLMGCTENWYNIYYALKNTFTTAELEAMTEEELNHLIKLGENIQEGLY